MAKQRLRLSEVYLKLPEILQLHDYSYPLIPVHPLYRFLNLLRDSVASRLRASEVFNQAEPFQVGYCD